MSGTVRIDEQLNLILPVDRADGTTAWVHAAPISRETFQQHYLVMARTFTALSTNLHPATIPTIAPLVLRDEIARSGGVDSQRGPADNQPGLIAEIRRLANVVVAGGPQPTYMPLDVAAQRAVLDPEDVEQVLGVLIFFSLASRLLPRKDSRIAVNGLASAWGASTSSQSLTAFGASLPTSNAIDSTGATPPAALSPPS